MSKDYPLHPGQTEMSPQFVQLPLENYEAISRELAELRTHEVEWDLAKARIKELEAENAKLKANQAWISPSDKLPNKNQEIEFIIRRKLFDDDDGVRMRVLGVYKQMFLNSQHCIFYASAPGWGSEFLPKEVECWMSKVPMPPEDKQ
jgi:hypothetical protein